MEQGCWKIDLLSEENVTPPNLNIRKNKLISWESKESLEIKSELNKEYFWDDFIKENANQCLDELKMESFLLEV